MGLLLNGIDDLVTKNKQINKQQQKNPIETAKVYSVFFGSVFIGKIHLQQSETPGALSGASRLNTDVGGSE